MFRAAGWMDRISTGERDEGGNAGREDDEQQPHNHLIGGFGIVFLPVADDGPGRPHIHQAQPQESDDGGDGGDELRGRANVAKYLLNSICEIQSNSSSLNDEQEPELPSVRHDEAGIYATECGLRSSGRMAAG